MRFVAISLLLAVSGVGITQNFPVMKFKNKPIPKFSLVDTAGQPVTSSNLRGKVYLVDFWATWCKPCVAAMPTMQKLNDKFKARGFQVIGANVLEYSGNKVGAAGLFKRKKGFTYRFTKCTKEAEQFASAINIIGLPTLILVDKKGAIRETMVGFEPTHEAELTKKIEALLKG